MKKVNTYQNASAEQALRTQDITPIEIPPVKPFFIPAFSAFTRFFLYLKFRKH